MNRRLTTAISYSLVLATALLAAGCSIKPKDWKLNPKDWELDGKYYAGAGYGGSGIEPKVVNSSNGTQAVVTDDVDSGVQLFVGRDISPRLAVEGYYSDMGSATLQSGTTTGEVSYSAAGVSGLLYLFGGGGRESLRNRTGFNIYGRVGGGLLENEGTNVQYNRDNDFHISTGLGVEYNLRNGFGLRGEFHNFDSDARVASINLIKRFGFNDGKLVRDINAVYDKSSDVPAKKVSDSDEDGIQDADDNCDSTPANTLVDPSGCEFSGVLEGVTFASGAAKLTADSAKVLDQVIDALKSNAAVNISIQAHTDNRGSARVNMDLSRNRAETVVRYLMKGGIDLSRLAAIGYGESRPRKSNKTAEGRSANRRVEIKVVE